MADNSYCQKSRKKVTPQGQCTAAWKAPLPSRFHPLDKKENVVVKKKSYAIPCSKGILYCETPRTRVARVSPFPLLMCVQESRPGFVRSLSSRRHYRARATVERAVKKSGVRRLWACKKCSCAVVMVREACRFWVCRVQSIAWSSRWEIKMSE